MIVLDENILEGQRLLLDGAHVAARQIGVDMGRKGLKDQEVIILLRQLRNVTFFTRDMDFYSPPVRHASYCLVVTTSGRTRWQCSLDVFSVTPLSRLGQNEGAVWFGSRTPVWQCGD